MLDLAKDKHYLLACSFGPDSMALCHMLLKEGYSFSLAHVNYHLRKEAEAEQMQLTSFCQNHHLNLYVYNVSENLKKGNLEKKCRDIRYDFFLKIMKKEKLDALLVAHHQDDLLETYFMQMKRNNLVSYYGIKKETVINEMNVVRPLLDYSKKDLYEYCLKNNVPFSIDQSNLSDRFLRNRIRHQIVEKLTKEEKEKYLKEIENKNEQLNKTFEKIGELSSTNINQYLLLNDEQFVYSLVLKGREIKKDFKISKKQGKEIKKILSSHKANVCLKIDGLIFHKNYDHFSFSKSEEDTNYVYVIEKPMRIETPYFFLDLTYNEQKRNVKKEDYPLTIRNAKPLDKYKIKNYFKLVRRLFIDWKMPTYLRNRWPVFINKKGEIIYIPRYQKEFLKDENINFYVKY